jgi:hypothetical protein
MDSIIIELIHKFQSLPHQIVLISNGVGIQLISWLQTMMASGFCKKSSQYFDTRKLFFCFIGTNGGLVLLEAIVTQTSSLFLDMFHQKILALIFTLGYIFNFLFAI